MKNDGLLYKTPPPKFSAPMCRILQYIAPSLRTSSGEFKNCLGNKKVLKETPNRQFYRYSFKAVLIVISLRNSYRGSL